MITRRTLSIGFALILGWALAGEAHAASWRTCNGSPVKWRGTLNVHRNRCSIPDTGIVNSAYWNGVRQWNDFSAVVSGFFVNSASDCFISYGDGQNEVGLANRSNIDGANGVTVLQLGLCFIGSNDIDEADIVLANDLNFSVRNGDFVGTSGRSTFVHEFGHFFGFLHEGSSAHSVMRTSPPHLIAGGSESATAWPADSIGMNSIYGMSLFRPNLLPAASGVVGGSVVSLDPIGTFSACRGTVRTTRFYLGNSGNASSGTYGLRVRISTLGPPSGYTSGGTVVASFTHTLGAFSQGTFNLSFGIPSSLPNGTYFIYLDMDPAGAKTEWREGDNRTLSRSRLRVQC